MTDKEKLEAIEKELKEHITDTPYNDACSGRDGLSRKLLKIIKKID